MKYADVSCTDCHHPASSHREFREDKVYPKQCKVKVVEHFGHGSHYENHCSCEKKKKEVIFDYLQKELDELLALVETKQEKPV
jgi:hypothetical protein